MKGRRKEEEGWEFWRAEVGVENQRQQIKM